MTVWYSSFDNKIMSDCAHKEYFNELIEEWTTPDNFSVFLDERYYIQDVFNFSESEKADALEEFRQWAHEKAEDDDVYAPYDVRLASDEVEE